MISTAPLTPAARERLGPAERIIQTLLQYADHMVHNRPGFVRPAPGVVGTGWEPAGFVVENDEKRLYRAPKSGALNADLSRRIGVIGADNVVREGGQVVGRYQPAGLFEDVVAYMYRQVAEVWKVDNEFAARWASYAYVGDHRDLKVLLAAFMLVQSRDGAVLMTSAASAPLRDADYRAVGEAMLLLRSDKLEFNPKLLLRVRAVLELPAVAAINRELGFGASTRRAPLGRWRTAVLKWLAHREANPALLTGLVRTGFRNTVRELMRQTRYVPSPAFVAALRWRQAQASDGRRVVSIGTAVTAHDSWEGLTESEICARIVKERPSWKKVVSLVPSDVGVSAAVLAAAIDAKLLSDRDLLMAAPTLESTGLLQQAEYKARFEEAAKRATDMRGKNIARRVQNVDTKKTLEDAADNALKAAMEETTRGLDIHVFVDVSGSMRDGLDAAQVILCRFLQGIPLERMKVAKFDTAGREVVIRQASEAGVRAAFAGIQPDGGTDYTAGPRALRQYVPLAGNDLLYVFIGDEQHPGGSFARYLRDMMPYQPTAIGLIHVGGQGCAVQETAQDLRIPCFQLDPAMFADPYAVTRTLRHLMAATPVSAANERRQIQQRVMPVRETLIDIVLKTPLLERPAWAEWAATATATAA